MTKLNKFKTGDILVNVDHRQIFVYDPPIKVIKIVDLGYIIQQNYPNKNIIATKHYIEKHYKLSLKNILLKL